MDKAVIIDSALYLASQGFHVFPLRPGSKFPMWRGWTEDATCDMTVVERIWTANPDCNVAISTTTYTNGKDWHVSGIDIDNKNGARGTDSAVALGPLLPETYVQRTPTGGYHYIYKSPTPVGNRVGRLGRGLDTRGWHGYLVGAGSIVPAGQYTIALSSPVAEAPQGLVDLIGAADTRKPIVGAPPAGVDLASAIGWAIQFLGSLPPATNGQINNSAFAAAARLKDRGLGPEDIYGLMLEYFRSELPMGEDELWSIAQGVYKYTKGPAGSAAPELLFKQEIKSDEEITPPPASETPIDWFNKDHAVCLIGSACYVLMKSTDSRGKPILKIMGVEAFHTLYAGMTFTDGEGKPKSMSRVWMNSPIRATFHGLEFAPGRELPSTHYNMWQGFAYEPQQIGDDRSHRALESFKYHLLHNLCKGDKELCHYVTSFFSHIYQKPQDKEPVSLVIRGQKGSGKDTLLNIIGAPLGPHYMTTARGTDITGQFNSAVESKLLCVYNEAFWHGDHKVEGVLKDLISGRTIRIERKGCEPYWVDNLGRTVIMGNEAVQVPATHDERRWVVIDMRDIPDEEKAAHKNWCTEMREGMEAGGYNLLVHYLLNYDISGVNIGIAPNTEGLVEQKEAGLLPVQLWFRECLGAGMIVGCGTPMGWPERLEKGLFRQAFQRWKEQNDISGRSPSINAFGRQLNEMKMGIDGAQKMPSPDGKHQVNVYSIPALEDCRKSWDKFIKTVKETKW